MKTVLIIDDDSAVLDAYRFALEEAGYGVVTASSGEEGLELARRKLPDLILSDIHMPGTDGRSVLRAIREDPSLCNRQVVLMTGNPTQATPRVGMELGADDFLVKPFGFEELTRCVAARLQRAKVHWRVEDRVVAELRANLHKVLPHEFFTPLAGLLGLVNILKEDFENTPKHEVREMLAEIEKCGWRLQHTLRNYLLIIEAAPSEPRSLEKVPGELVRETVENAAVSAASRLDRQADLRFQLTPPTLLCRPSDLAIIVEELVDNACSFSPRGSEIHVRLDAAGVFAVEDRGRGMRPEQMEHIGAFRQFDRGKFEQQGLGLGLALVQRLVATGLARLTIDSAPERGTTVRIEFPTAPL